MACCSVRAKDEAHAIGRIARRKEVCTIMTMTSTAHENGSPSKATPATSPRWTLDDLARKNATELGAIYAKGTLPTLADLDGAPLGRMLAFVGPLGRGRAADGLRRFAESLYFPWGGKSFTSKSSREGAGINRVRVLGDLFRFETRIGPSKVDGKPCLILDYDLSPNPWFIRKIHDELRQVSPRLFLGPAMWKTRGGAKLVLYFAIAP
jgi:hypothetical protein